MKLYAFSDSHGADLDKFIPKDADICVIAGDIAPLNGFSSIDMEKQKRWMETVFCEFVNRHPKTEFVFIAGNHDFWGLDISPTAKYWSDNAHYLRNSGCTVKGITFFGVPQVPEIGASRRWAFESSHKALEAAFDEIPMGVDILITHTPPRITGFNIDSSGRDIYTGELTHFGSMELHDAIVIRQPRYNICGHIHTGDHKRINVCSTQCYNVSVLDEQYQVAYKPLALEV